MPYEFYKVAHVVGIVTLFMALGAISSGSTRGKVWGSLHGASLLIILIAGFGLLARLGMTNGLPGWIWAKIGLWLVFGIMIALIRRIEFLKNNFWILGPILGFVAAYLAVYKPF